MPIVPPHIIFIPTWIRKDGHWAQAQAFVRKGGQWHLATAYIRHNGKWVKASPQVP